MELKKFEAKNGMTWNGAIRECMAYRPPPIPPDDFEALLLEGVHKEEAHEGTGIKFTCGKDLTDVVIPQYADGFVRLMSQTEILAYGCLQWADEEIRQVSRCFGYLQRRMIALACTELWFPANNITSEGAEILAACITSNAVPNLQYVLVHRNQICSKGLRLLIAALAHLHKERGDVGQTMRICFDDNPGSMSALQFAIDHGVQVVPSR